MSERPQEGCVFIFGAGATAACGGPLTNELLPGLFKLLASNENPDNSALEKLVTDFGRFVRETFHLNVDDRWKAADDAIFPSVPLLLSVMNMAADRNQPIGAWSAQQLSSLRLGAQAALLSAIEMQLLDTTAKPNPYDRLFARAYEEHSEITPVAITLNYDTILDKVMVKRGSTAARRIPDYGCDIVVDDGQVPRFGRLLKLHGSLNWLYCRRCARLSLHMSGVKQSSGLLDELFDSFEDLAVIAALERPDDAKCRRCSTALGPLIITPALMKDYRNPHVSRIWYEAEQALRNADRAVFIGYSLPWDDVEVIYLLKQALEHLPPERIVVVEHSKTPVPIDRHEAGQRYATLFGRQIRWFPLGFEGWLDDCDRRGVSPFDVEN